MVSHPSTYNYKSKGRTIACKFHTFHLQANNSSEASLSQTGSQSKLDSSHDKDGTAEYEAPHPSTGLLGPSRMTKAQNTWKTDHSSQLKIHKVSLGSLIFYNIILKFHNE